MCLRILKIYDLQCYYLKWNISIFKEPKLYVSTILDVHKKYNALVLTAFANDSGFVASLDKACGKFINNNSVTKKANASTKSPGKYIIHTLDSVG